MKFHKPFLNDQENELYSDPYVEICGYHFYTYIWLIILFSTEKVKHSYPDNNTPGKTLQLLNFSNSYVG